MCVVDGCKGEGEVVMTMVTRESMEVISALGHPKDVETTGAVPVRLYFYRY